MIILLNTCFLAFFSIKKWKFSFFRKKNPSFWNVEFPTLQILHLCIQNVACQSSKFYILDAVRPNVGFWSAFLKMVIFSITHILNLWLLDNFWKWKDVYYSKKNDNITFKKKICCYSNRHTLFAPFRHTSFPLI